MGFLWYLRLLGITSDMRSFQIESNTGVWYVREIDAL